MTTMQLGKVNLNVLNLNKQIEFYENVIGLSVLNRSQESADLGIEGSKVLLSLKQVSMTESKLRTAGLYHVAFLLPIRADLGGILRHLLAIKAPLEGASDHGYSEAIYLQDPEGNGIEIYWDKDKSEWDIQPDGTIVGVIEPMDAQTVLAKAPVALTKMPKGTTVGHVHLSVSDIVETGDFYTNILDFNLTYNYGSQAKFLSLDGYHHHIAANIWLGEGVAKRKKEAPGIHSYVMNWQDESAWDELKQRIIKYGVPIFNETEESFQIEDPNGIIISMER